MLYKVEFDDNGNSVIKKRIEHLWISKTRADTYKTLFQKDKEIPYITPYLWETREAAAKWARHCLKKVKDKIRVAEIKDLKDFVYRIEYYYEGHLLATTEQTGLIIGECNNEDW